MATIFPTQEKVTMKVPQITVSQAGDYVGQYVTVKNLTPAANSTTWVVNKKTTSVNFTDDAELPMVARTTNHAVFANEAIAIKKADLSGIMEIYKGGYQIFPNSMVCESPSLAISCWVLSAVAKSPASPAEALIAPIAVSNCALSYFAKRLQCFAGSSLAR